MTQPQSIDTAPRPGPFPIWLYDNLEGEVLGRWRFIPYPGQENLGQVRGATGWSADAASLVELRPLYWAPYVEGEQPPPWP